MNERGLDIKQAGCLEWGHRENNGTIQARDLFFYRRDRDKIYSITVGTPSYIQGVRQRNLEVTDPDLRLDDNIFPLDDLSEVEAICKKLHAAPFEALKPFASEQIEQPQPSVPTDTYDIDKFEI